MNWDIIKGKWGQLKGEARKQWGNLTDDDWDKFHGDREKLSAGPSRTRRRTSTTSSGPTPIPKIKKKPPF